MKKILIAILSCVVLTACAKHTNEIQAQYISPLEYQSYNCRQISSEMTAVSRKVSEIGGQVDKTASDDSAQMGVGLILFWPALFFLDGDTPQAVEYARLKGEFNALEKAANLKGCGFKIEPLPQPTPVSNKTTSRFDKDSKLNGQ